MVAKKKEATKKKTAAKKIKVKNKGGRATKFTEKVREKIRFLSRIGVPANDIANLIDVKEQTYYNWQNKHTEFFESLNNWKDLADSEVERSLYERACGYTHPETKVHYDTEMKEWVSIKVEKHYPPDPSSMIFWLKNRQPLVWRDRKVVDMNNITVKIDRKRFDGE